jgi:cbb3-type cytochrome oxidase subunit 1
MPRLSVLFIRAALVYLAVGFTFGGLMLFHKGIALHPALWRLLPAHVEFVLFGWTVQLAMGVGFWILPRFGQGPERGDERPAWVAFVVLNIGVLLVALGGVLDAPAWSLVLGRVAEAAAAVAFALHAWPRVKPLLSPSTVSPHPRE